MPIKSFGIICEANAINKLHEITQSKIKPLNIKYNDLTGNVYPFKHTESLWQILRKVEVKACIVAL